MHGLLMTPFPFFLTVMQWPPRTLTNAGGALGILLHVLSRLCADLLSTKRYLTFHCMVGSCMCSWVHVLRPLLVTGLRKDRGTHRPMVCVPVAAGREGTGRR